MHSILIIITLLVAWGIRYTWQPQTGPWRQRWQRAVVSFLFPPLLLLGTAIAILCMGPNGQMIGIPTEGFSYWGMMGYLLFALSLSIKRLWVARQTQHQLRTSPEIELPDTPARLLTTDTPYSAQIGLWQPTLVISQGLLNTLDTAHLNAVLRHEQAHSYYHDTFWFFLWGGLRAITPWLPKTEALWEELLLLRELRADAFAKQQTDPLLLAESLLLVISAPSFQGETTVAALNDAQTCDRLQERIEALLSEETPEIAPQYRQWSWLLLTLLPMIAVPFHN
ncbi:M56 family metallopeptidase [Spirulina sp. CS-785/01]|uniref:M56 family metallopeptidase n=1 Tax=Spirulina sp. CS-785/01 TaxID=3021716 RepID=UPI00232F3012|nr:M56 family metallopeptidase [Spirulina sp. CS-785/01]MDB9311513.1 M56 family metallopeptidase [Spirulina sp. CS-785/01]